MDGALTPKAGSGGKAVVPVPAGIDAGAAAANTSSARGARNATTLPATAVGAADVPAAATATPGTVSNNGSGGGKEDEDDEQVERFYALLDNIRAMRGAYGSAPGDGTGALDDGVVDTGGGGARAKRLRGSEPPWRPAFRLEDFEEPAPMPSSSSDVMAPSAKKRTRGQQEEADGDGEGSGAARPDVAAVVRVRLDSGTAKSV